MRLSKSDSVAVILGIAILSVLGYLLYADIMDRSGTGKTKLIGEITAKRNTAERKFSSQVIWDEIYKGSSLYNYDTVRTADNSEATIRLKDGTVITLNENSMILLSLSEKELDIKFIQGTMSASQSGAKGGKARKVNIESGDSKISLRNGDVSLAQDRDNQLQMTVNRGKATLQSGGKEKVINENQNILAGKDTIRLYDLTIKLISPDNNKFIPSTPAKTTVPCSWEQPRGDYDTYLEVAANPAVSDPLVRIKSARGNSAVRLDDGVYYWRVTAVNRVTKKIESSEIRKFTIVNDKPVYLISPADRSVIRYRDANPMINFIWSKNESVPRYRLMVSVRPDMSAPAVNTVVEGNKIALNSLGQSTYYWKVANISDADLGRGNSESPVFTFTVSKTETVEPPEPLSPANNKTIHPRTITTRGLNFTWTKDPSIVTTDLSISEDRGMSRVIAARSSRDNSFRLAEELKEGTYYWGLRGVMSDGSKTDRSRVLSFKVGATGTLQLIEPADRAIILTPKEKNASDVSFSWSKTDFEGTFIVQIAKTRNFDTVIKEISASDLSAVMPNLPLGQYFCRVKMIDEKNTILMTSNVNSFEVLSILDTPVAIGPRSGSAVNMLKRDTLDFTWRPVRNANLYRIGLYQVKAGIQYSVATLETRATTYKFAALNKLDEGRFIWTLQALETEAGTNRVKRKSEEARAPFEITLGIKKGLKLDSNKVINTESE
jgi:hypothetical protein